MDRSTPDFPVLHQLPELAQTHVHRVVIPSNHLILCLPFSSCLQSFPASGFFPMSQFFASRGQSIGISDSHQSVQWIFRTISFRMDWLDLLVVQGTLKSLLQHHGSKASILQCSILDFLYSPTLTSIHDYWKNHSFKAMDQCWQSNVSAFYMLSRFVIAFFQGATIF